MAALSLLLLLAAGALIASAAAVTAAGDRPPRAEGQQADAHGPIYQGIHKIQHVVVIMQENRSFDSYFGTYPGADGIPMTNGAPIVCNPAPKNKQCVKPYHDRNDRNGGGPHFGADARADIAGGTMSGFIARAASGRRGCLDATNPACSNSATPDVMGYHDARDIPNYWVYANHFVLQDHMFSPTISWSLPSHLYMVSGWSARCGRQGDPTSCRSATNDPAFPPGFLGTTRAPDYAWTDLTYLLDKRRVSWGYYVFAPRTLCTRFIFSCPRFIRRSTTPAIWNPLPYFDTVRQDKQGGISRMSRTSTPRPARPACPPCPGLYLAARSASTRQPWSAPASPTSRGSSTPSCVALSGTARQSSCPGTTGAASTTMWRRPPSTEKATASACRAW